MKKLYTIALAAAVTMTASALNLNVKNLQLGQTVPVLHKNFHKAEGLTVKSMTKVADKFGKRTKVSTKAEAADFDIEGTWEFTMGDYYLSISSFESIVIEYEATIVDEGVVYFEDPMGYELPFIAEYDAASGFIDFPAAYLGIVATPDGEMYGTQEPYVVDLTTDELEFVEAFYGQVDAATQSIVFEGLGGIAWCGYVDEQFTELAGYFAIYDFEAAGKSAGWTLMENGLFNENLIYGTFTGEENTQYAEVDIYANNGIYKVKNPYKTLYAALSLDGVSPDLVINAKDPDNVMIELQSVGLTGGADGVYYLFNEGWYAAEYDEELDPALICTLTKDAEGNVEIIFPYHSCTVYASTSQKFYYGSSYESVLKFKEVEAGVNEVGIDNSNAPVEYYNLQGVRVANPAAGQLIIKKQGTEVSKVLVK